MSPFWGPFLMTSQTISVYYPVDLTPFETGFSLVVLSETNHLP